MDTGGDRNVVEQVAASVVDACVRVHRELGAGLLESVYQTCLSFELRSRGHDVREEVPVPIRYRGRLLESRLRLDLTVDDQVVVENKAVQEILPVHRAQLLTCLRLAGFRLGSLVNWNVPLIKQGIVRMVNGR